MLDWPVSQKVKAFPRRKAVLKMPKRREKWAQGPPASQMPGQVSGGFEQQPANKKKVDPWLFGCLTVIVIMVIAVIIVLLMD